MNTQDRNMQTEIAEGEAWLSRFGMAPPSADFLARLKQSVRDELANTKAPPRSLLRIRAWHGSLAAAAMIALAVGMAWYSRYLTPESIIVVSTEQIETDEQVIEAIATAASIDSLAELEELVDTDAWTVDGSSLYDALESAFDEESDSLDSTGTSSSRATRRITTGEVS